MNLLTSRKSWLLAPLVFILCVVALLVVWMALEPKACIAFVDNEGCSPFELMTLPLFALIIPMAWLTCPVGGSLRRQCGWSALYSLLGFMALVREQDWHKTLFADIWPEVASTFKGTVYKMRFLTASDVPLAPKLFVLVFFILFFVAVGIPLLRYFIPLMRGFFRFEPVAWTMAFFGGASVLVAFFDRLPSNLRHTAWAIGEGSTAQALFKILEEGNEMIMALLGLLAILQAHLIFNRGQGEVKEDIVRK